MYQEPQFRIGQWAEYVSKDRWKWSCWVEASDEDLDRINSVTWILHPTFTPSRVNVATRSNKFRLDSGGWGTFTVRATLHFDNKDTLELHHALKLRYPESQSASAEESSIESCEIQKPDDASHKPTVFLSFSSENAKQAQAIQEIISNRGVSVLNANLADPGQPLGASVEKMIRESDAVITIDADDYRSHFVMLEAKIAEAEGKPVLSVAATYDWLSSLREGSESAIKGSNDEHVKLDKFMDNLGSA